MALLWVQIRSAIGRLRGIAAFWWKAFSQSSIDLTLRTHAGLVPGIHVLLSLRQRHHGRDKPGHDGSVFSTLPLCGAA